MSIWIVERGAPPRVVVERSTDRADDEDLEAKHTVKATSSGTLPSVSLFRERTLSDA